MDREPPEAFAAAVKAKWHPFEFTMVLYSGSMVRAPAWVLACLALAIPLLLFSSFIVLGGIRFASRIRQEGLDVGGAPALAGSPRPVLIYGAGDAGHQLIRLILTDARSDFRVVGFLDDHRFTSGPLVVRGRW